MLNRRHLVSSSAVLVMLLVACGGEASPQAGQTAAPAALQSPTP